MPTYKVQPGDSWIGIARKYNLNLNDLLYWNGVDPLSREALPTINPNQDVYVSDPYTLQPARINKNAPKNYIDFGEQGQQIITNYALALKQGKITLNEIPEVYRTPAYQKSITLTTDQAANMIAKTGINLGLFLTDPVGYVAGVTAQKGLAYANDELSGRNEYDIKDIFDYTPIMGTEYTDEHPYRSLLTDVVAGAIGGTALRNAPTIFSNTRQAAQNAINTTGLTRQTIPAPRESGRVSGFGSVFKEGSKTSGKTGTVRAGRPNGYTPNTSVKGVFSNEASGNSANWNFKNSAWIPGGISNPISNPLPFKPGFIPIWWNNKERNVSVIRPDAKHIYEQQSFNNWTQDMQSGWRLGKYQPGTGVYSITGEAPIGNTIEEQALTKESLQVLPGDYTPRVSKYVSGTISGTPSSIFSGLGINYSTNNPGNLIIK